MYNSLISQIHHTVFYLSLIQHPIGIFSSHILQSEHYYQLAQYTFLFLHISQPFLTIAYLFALQPHLNTAIGKYITRIYSSGTTGYFRFRKYSICLVFQLILVFLKLYFVQFGLFFRLDGLIAHIGPFCRFRGVFACSKVFIFLGFSLVNFPCLF